MNPLVQRSLGLGIRIVTVPMIPEMPAIVRVTVRGPRLYVDGQFWPC